VRGIERQALQLYGIPISAKTIIELSRSGDPAATWMVRRVGK